VCELRCGVCGSASGCKFCGDACRSRTARPVEAEERRKQLYDRDHHRRRRLLAPLVATGTVVCPTCGRLIMRGQAWDLGHRDGVPGEYLGAQHARCNRRTTKARRPYELKFETQRPRS